MNQIDTVLNMKDLPPAVPAAGIGSSKDKSRRIVDKQGKLVQDDANLYKKIASEDELAERITNIDALSLEDLRDVIVKLTMINALPKESQTSLKSLHLNLSPSTRRCENIHGGNNCTTVWGTMAVKKCRGGYVRSGCCRCSLPCPSQGFVDKGPICYKDKPYQTNSYSNIEDCYAKNELKKELCVDLGMGSYTEVCDPGFIRTGRYTCIKTCPVGWPDEG